jgi:hypothetical protein
MTPQIIRRLDFLISIIPDLLREINEVDFSLKPASDKWSKKQILGHLIDSATNNHQRFIRGQFEDTPTIGYNQNEWNRHSHYNEINSGQLIDFWTSYNKHLLEIMKRMPAASLQKECRSADGTTCTIAFLMEDYLAHLEHHLKQIVTY